MCRHPTAPPSTRPSGTSFPLLLSPVPARPGTTARRPPGLQRRPLLPGGEAVPPTLEGGDQGVARHVPRGGHTGSPDQRGALKVHGGRPNPLPHPHPMRAPGAGPMAGTSAPPQGPGPAPCDGLQGVGQAGGQARSMGAWAAGGWACLGVSGGGTQGRALAARPTAAGTPWACGTDGARGQLLSHHREMKGMGRILHLLSGQAPHPQETPVPGQQPLTSRCSGPPGSRPRPDPRQQPWRPACWARLGRVGGVVARMSSRPTEAPAQVPPTPLGGLASHRLTGSG